jgi:hypothetical protein
MCWAAVELDARAQRLKVSAQAAAGKKAAADSDSASVTLPRIDFIKSSLFHAPA